MLAIVYAVGTNLETFTALCKRYQYTKKENGMVIYVPFIEIPWTITLILLIYQYPQTSKSQNFSHSQTQVIPINFIEN